MLCALWLAFGLSLLAMCFNLMQEEVKEKVKWVGLKIGLLRNEDEGWSVHWCGFVGKNYYVMTLCMCVVDAWWPRRGLSVSLHNHSQWVSMIMQSVPNQSDTIYKIYISCDISQGTVTWPVMWSVWSPISCKVCRHCSWDTELVHCGKMSSFWVEEHTEVYMG